MARACPRTRTPTGGRSRRWCRRSRSAQRIYDQHRWGEIPDELWVDCVTASNVDDTLAPPGTHVMTAFVQYVPFELREGDLGRAARRAAGARWSRRSSGTHPAIRARRSEATQVVTPLDLERTYGLTEGNIFHGDLNIEQLFFMRPLARRGPVPHADRGSVPVRGRRAPRRRRDRRAGLRRVARGPARPEAAAAVALRSPCPNCGRRPSTEFAFGGELRPARGARRGGRLRSRVPPGERRGSAARTLVPRPRLPDAGSRSPATRGPTEVEMTPGRLRFEGREVPVLEGDTVASALYRAGVRTFSRSLKYHRRRGLYCGTGDCPNCSVTVDGVPGVRSCITPRGRAACASNARAGGRRPSATCSTSPISLHRADAGRLLLQDVHPAAVRVADGRAGDPAGDGFRTAAHGRAGHAHRLEARPCDTIVVGAGTAGLTAALEAAVEGERVLLCDEVRDRLPRRTGSDARRDPGARGARPVEPGDRDHGGPRRARPVRWADACRSRARASSCRCTPSASWWRPAPPRRTSSSPATTCPA